MTGIVDSVIGLPSINMAVLAIIVIITHIRAKSTTCTFI